VALQVQSQMATEEDFQRLEDFAFAGVDREGSSAGFAVRCIPAVPEKYQRVIRPRFHLRFSLGSPLLFYARVLSAFTHWRKANNYGEAPAVLGLKRPVIRGLVEQGIVHATGEYRFGLSKLLAAADVQRFAERLLGDNRSSPGQFHLTQVRHGIVGSSDF
jgi:hypothetical protein